tara:strand:+ start:351 stop:1382 length:1032 start_codon:yes stop_codon:yes gene_type:complete
MGCANLGPTTLKSERSNYNLAIQRTNDEQLLLNLVRLKYRDTPFFMEVSSVASQFSLSSTANASATLQDGVKGLFGLGGSVGMTEKPTVTYSPLQGNKFIQRVLSPLPLKTVVLLFHSGWSIERIFRLCFQQMNSQKNAPSASGPTPSLAPQFKGFASAVKFLRELQIQGAISLSYYESNGVPNLLLHINEEDKNREEAKQLALALNVEPGKTRYVLTFSPAFNETNQIRVVTRSLLGIMFYLSQAVEVPSQDVLLGKVTQTKTSAGNIFDWKEVTGDLLRIRSLPGKPETSPMVIFYRGTWFYIDDSDLSSKSTFSLLAQIFSLQAGKIKDNAPLLTLPIGQ